MAVGKYPYRERSERLGPCSTQVILSVSPLGSTHVTFSRKLFLAPPQIDLYVHHLYVRQPY